ncbi:SusC/RagA family TonB-linked outer membrane protein [Mucilaginibacter robiniae]|uniref:SusC/RagA family TonB-linked outer membrane protein n=1 Tax=Mucilaginibacter robiniae TaxID=2728022 RepID=A0A7L5E4H8_9SPHI|nr:SusC/RagA family TonB-linked outer membrane protein [Mucilaginibacter robiniae]QJD95246.1 SusC/RagA family TonB-linked outer membrane protein [Mucilaginibacter robiniae]
MLIFTNKTFLLLLFGLLIGSTVKAQVPDSVARYKADSLQKARGPKVSGIIRDAATGKPVSGININIFEYTAAISDERGRFTIGVPDYNAVLMVSGQGYQQKEVPVKGQETLPDIWLYEDTYNSVYDVATLPLKTTPINQLVNSVSTINTQGAWETAAEIPDTYLQGKVAGLNAIRRSGTPNIGANLFLRGYNSLYGTNMPLVVVDGMIYDVTHYGRSLIGGHITNPLGDIDIHDVDNITVIKDAASVYGTKAANGVIVITTGHSQDLATKIDLGIYSSYNYVPHTMFYPVMQASDYRTYLSEVLNTSGMSPTQIAAQPYMNDNLSNPDYYTYHNNTNWQKQVFKNGYNQNYNLRVAGGDNIAKYVLSVGYGNNKGISQATDLSRYTTRFNADLNISRHFTVNTNLSFSYNEQNLRDQGVYPKTNPLYVGLIKSPLLRANEVNNQGIESPNISDSDIFGVSNPIAINDNVQALSKNYRFFGNINFRYQINKYLVAQTLIGVTSDKIRENTFIPRAGIVNDTLNNAIADSRLGSRVQRLYTLYNDTRVTYDRVFSRIHHLTASVGSRFNQTSSNELYALGYNSAIDQLVTVGTGAPSLRAAGGDIGKYRWFNNYLSADYQLLGKYFLNYSMAVDASSRFGSTVANALTIDGVKMAVLPSVAAGWLISSEKFMSNVRFIELLKLRASYGLTGNDDIGNYAARQFYVSQNLLGLQGLVRGNIGNSSLQWEVNRKLDIGLDASLLKERLTITADVFRNTTSKMITYDPTAAATGFTYAVYNNGNMQNTGVELSVNGRLINKNSFKWDLGVNLATYRNKVTKFPGTSMQTTYAGANILTQVGMPANVFYGYKTNGVYQSDAEAAGAGLSVRTSTGSLIALKGGDMRFVDMNGDKVIDSQDMQVIGNPNPKLTGGLSTDVTYKRFTLSALVTFVSGNQIYNYTRRILESENGTQNQTLAVLNRWRADGQVTNMPKAVYGDPAGNSRFSDRWIENGSYIRLRTVSLMYNVPVKAKTFKYIKIYATGNNLLTFTKYLGYDPEFSAGDSPLMQGIDAGFEPQIRTVQLGARLGI